MPTTSNFGWTTPADTDLVKDGAAAIRTLGNGIDTSLLDLKGGTSGQVLSKNSNTDLDYTWVTPNVGDITEVQAGVGISVASGTGPIPIITNSSTDLITTAGDLLYGTAADTVARLGIGTAGQVLQVNSGATAPEWQTVSSGALTKISRQSVSAASSVDFDGVFTSTYNSYLVFVEQLLGSTTQSLKLQAKYSTNTIQTSDYYGASVTGTSSTSTSAGADLNISNNGISSNAGNVSNYQILFSPMGNDSVYSVVSGYGVSGNQNAPVFFGGYAAVSRVYTGFKIFPSTGTFTGTFSVYGLAK